MAGSPNGARAAVGAKRGGPFPPRAPPAAILCVVVPWVLGVAAVARLVKKGQESPRRVALGFASAWAWAVPRQRSERRTAQGLEEEAASSSTHNCELGEVDLPSWGPVDEAGFSPRVTWQMFFVGVWSSRWWRGPSRKAARRVFRGTWETWYAAIYRLCRQASIMLKNTHEEKTPRGAYRRQEFPSL